MGKGSGSWGSLCNITCHSTTTGLILGIENITFGVVIHGGKLATYCTLQLDGAFTVHLLDQILYVKCRPLVARLSILMLQSLLALARRGSHWPQLSGSCFPFASRDPVRQARRTATAAAIDHQLSLCQTPYHSGSPSQVPILYPPQCRTRCALDY